ncbi:hypothetical protein BKP64_04620 [Marinobacter salinus]|uniref:Glycosyltransferase 2-like domain-containing protein n=1 Tax=Marinobacter salinus TaxID=1874317 RepID=A0A1D9GIP1_9GAMM|nr:glycosyltransferase family 2 protein [Marinobacter salinus]AOY87512.1 hypothetical protein BKP64_04620 [Marinobacter salinus]
MISDPLVEASQRQSESESTPFFSIIMPCFNSESYLEESIRSVLEQTETDFELIVVDDGSSDSSTSIIQDINKQDQRVKLAVNKGGKGASGARNYGASVCVGEWLCFLDSDDLFEPNALAQRRDAASKAPSCEFFSSDFFRWQADDKSPAKLQTDVNDYWKFYFKKAGTCGLYILTEDIAPIFIKAPLAWTGGVTMKKSLFMELGGFDEALIRAEDDHLWIRGATKTGRVGLIGYPDAYYRIRTTGLSQGTGARTPYSPIMLKRLLKEPLLKNYKSQISDKLELETYLLSLYYRECGNRRLAIQFAWQSFQASSFKYSKLRNLVGTIINNS